MAASFDNIDPVTLTQLVAAGIRPALRHAALWQTWLMPAVSDTVDAMIACGDVPAATAEAFEDAGQFLMRVSADIFAARDRLGLPFSDD